MKGKTRKIIIFCLFIVALYLGFKFYCYNIYSNGDSGQISDVKISGNMTINHIDLNDSEYYTFQDIKFKNVFDGFEMNSDDPFLRMIKKVDSNISDAILIGSEQQYIDILKNDEEYKGVFNKIAKKENINDDIDLLKYMEKHNDDEVKFFMPLIKQKQIHTLNVFKISMLPSIHYIKTVDGYYKGFMFKTTKDTFEVVLIENNKRYFFTFLGNYDEEFINDFMNSVIIEKK